ncbi:sulfite exporter TauE/SafE family protein [Candidatus Binatia bacterium]|nr:sulfite exporter TauE/SafE family protein [Candidatus Binatia bacterium]
MSFDLAFLALVVIVWFAFVSEAATGFGSTIISVTLGALFYPIGVLVAPLVPANVLVLGYLVGRHHLHADWRLIRGRILPWMATGTGLGLVLLQRLAAPALQEIFGAVVVALAAREVLAWWRGPAVQRPLSPLVQRASLFGAGLTHGLFATGGPLLVYAVSRGGLNKAAFRSTLSVVLLVLNVCLTVAYLVTGRFTAATLPYFAVLVPVAALGILGGEWLHGRLPEDKFRAAVFALLGFAGLVTLLK